MSIPVSAIKLQVISKAQEAGTPKPKCQATHADRTPVVSSTSGYRAEILVLHAAQRPRKTNQLTTGMFCQALMGALHCGQAERGVLSVKGANGATVALASRSAERTSVAWARHSRSKMVGSR